MESFDPAQHYAARYPAHVVCVRVIREEIAAIAVECGFDDTEVSDVRLAVSEVAANAVVHGYDGAEAPGEIRVSATYSDERLSVVIADDGSGIAPRVDSPGLGLGLPIVATVAQSVELHRGEKGGTEVHLTFQRPGASPADGPPTAH